MAVRRARDPNTTTTALNTVVGLSVMSEGEGDAVCDVHALLQPVSLHGSVCHSLAAPLKSEPEKRISLIRYAQFSHAAMHATHQADKSIRNVCAQILEPWHWLSSRGA